MLKKYAWIICEILLVLVALGIILLYVRGR